MRESHISNACLKYTKTQLQLVDSLSCHSVTHLMYAHLMGKNQNSHVGGWIHLVHPHKFMQAGQPVYKVVHSTSSTELQHGEGTCMATLPVADPCAAEHCVLEMFDATFTQRKDLGHHHLYEGNLGDMVHMLTMAWRRHGGL